MIDLVVSLLTGDLATLGINFKSSSSRLRLDCVVRLDLS